MVTQIVHYYSALKTAFTLYWILRSRNVKSKSRSFLKVGRYSQIMLLITKHFINSQFLQQYVSVPIFLHPQKYKIFSILLIFVNNDQKNLIILIHISLKLVISFGLFIYPFSDNCTFIFQAISPLGFLYYSYVPL